MQLLGLTPRSWTKNLPLSSIYELTSLSSCDVTHMVSSRPKRYNILYLYNTFICHQIKYIALFHVEWPLYNSFIFFYYCIKIVFPFSKCRSLIFKFGCGVVQLSIFLSSQIIRVLTRAVRHFIFFSICITSMEIFHKYVWWKNKTGRKIHNSLSSLWKTLIIF